MTLENSTNSQKEVRTLVLSTDAAAALASMSDDEIAAFLQAKQLNLQSQHVKIKTEKGESERYFSSAAEIRRFASHSD